MKQEQSYSVRLRTMTKKEERQAIHGKYGGKCAYCGCGLEKGWHVDHFLPIGRYLEHILDKDGNKLRKDGEKWGEYLYRTKMEYPERDTFENKIPSCASCNINKHSMGIEDFRNLIHGFMKYLNGVSTQYKLAKRYGLVKETNAKVVFYFETLS